MVVLTSSVAFRRAAILFSASELQLEFFFVVLETQEIAAVYILLRAINRGALHHQADSKGFIEITMVRVSLEFAALACSWYDHIQHSNSAIL